MKPKTQAVLSTIGTIILFILVIVILIYFPWLLAPSIALVFILTGITLACYAIYYIIVALYKGFLKDFKKK